MRKIDTAHDLGRVLREARKAQSLTQPELAGLLGKKSHKTVNAAEQGEGDTMELRTVLALTQALGIRIFVQLPGEAGPLLLQDGRDKEGGAR